jgi:hypothetical protein
MNSLVPEIVVLAWKTPSASKPAAVLCIYQGFLVEEAESSINAALAKGVVDHARTFRGLRGNYVPLTMYCADKEVPAEMK